MQPRTNDTITLFLCGDAMTGRGIDQILPHPGDPRLCEPYVRNAIDYVQLAESKSGPIARPVDYAYIWGDALTELARAAPDAGIVNLETAVTVANEPWPDKSVHYRMHPANVACLTAAGIDCCTIANNHVLDWGYAGLAETLETLQRAGIRTAGAGRDVAQASAPAIVEMPDKGRVVVFAFGVASSGVPSEWAADSSRAGVMFLPDLSLEAADSIAEHVKLIKQPRDVVVASIHWGGNWGFEIPAEQRRFAHRLIDRAAVDVVHGHSSHHVKGIEVYRDRPILYGCGDFLNDYEGIGGYEAYRGELALMYFPTFDVESGRLLRLAMTPTRTQHFRASRADAHEVGWLCTTLNREGRALGTRVLDGPDHTLLLEWR